MSDKFKARGYVEKVVYNGKIEYRNYNPDLVGLQLTSDGGTPLFTMGNFSITTNMDPKLNKTFITNAFSQFYSLDNLNLNVAQTEKLIEKNTATILNLDKTKIKNYALFGSFSEFVRVSLEEIIMKWPASLYLVPGYTNSIGTVVTGPTFEDYLYDDITNISTFKVNNSLINNKFNINFLSNGTILDTFNETNDLRNITVNYLSYSVSLNNVEYPILGFTGSTHLTDDYIYLEVEGPVFTNKLNSVSYHIKPNKMFEDIFFNGLNEFEGYLLNRLILPKYTATFNFPIKSDSGVLLHVERSVTWPVLDGYNIEFESPEYVAYATDLLDIANNSDLTETNLMVRFLVAESITSFDTLPVHLDDAHMDTSGQKINKTLSLYGREYDDLNRYINGISFANVVSYNKQDNTPDKYLKDLARVLGWDLITSVIENDLLANYVTTGDAKFSGETVGLTAVEADIELWRRLILNSSWIWKSKGARKAIEFLLRFIGTPKGLVEFNEYIYKADGPIDMDLFIKSLMYNDLDVDTTFYPIDDDGYPRFFPDSEDMYFQNNGLWYRETGGNASTIDILTGNNPHVGPYDGGFKYLNQLTTLIPNFSAVTITSETITTGATNLFTNYDFGKITDYTGETYVNITTDEGVTLPDCIIATTEIVKDPLKTDLTNDCGCETGLNDDSLSINIKKVDNTETLLGPPVKLSVCDTIKTTRIGDNSEVLFTIYQYNKDGSKFQVNGNDYTIDTLYGPVECCTKLGGTSTYMDSFNVFNNDEIIVDSGYICCANNDEKCLRWSACNWVINPTIESIDINGVSTNMLLFISFFGYKDVMNELIGKTTYLVPTASLCPEGWSVPINITDPLTSSTGIGCKLTNYGIQNYQSLVTLYITKAENRNCDYTFPKPDAPYTPSLVYNVYDRVHGLDSNTRKEIDWYFGDHSPERIKCVWRNPQSVISQPYGVWLAIIMPKAYSVFPIDIGVQLYESNTLNAKQYTSLNGNYIINLPIGRTGTEAHVVSITNGVVTNIINMYNIIENCNIY